MPISIKHLEEYFGATHVRSEPTNTEKTYLNERNQLEDDIPCHLSIKQYMYFYDLFCSYGLEDKMLHKLTGEIGYRFHFEHDQFIGSTFYQKFSDKSVVQRYMNGGAP